MNEPSLPDADSALLRRGVLYLGRRLRAQRSDANEPNPNALGVLGHLHWHGASSPGSIATAQQLQPQSLTRSFAELESKQWVLRLPHPTDKRQHLLKITPSGQQALKAAMQARDAWLEVAMASLTPTERQVLALAGGLMARIADSGSNSGSN